MTETKNKISSAVYIAISLQLASAIFSFSGAFLFVTGGAYVIYVLAVCMAFAATMINAAGRKDGGATSANYHNYMLDTAWIVLLLQIACWVLVLKMGAMFSEISDAEGIDAQIQLSQELATLLLLGGTAFSIVSTVRVGFCLACILLEKTCHSFIGFSQQKEPADDAPSLEAQETLSLRTVPWNQALTVAVISGFVMYWGGFFLALAGVFVFIDALTAGIAKKPDIKAFANMGPAAWGLACQLLFIVAIPAYLINRHKLVARINKPIWLVLVTYCSLLFLIFLLIDLYSKIFTA